MNVSKLLYHSSSSRFIEGPHQGSNIAVSEMGSLPPPEVGSRREGERGGRTFKESTASDADKDRLIAGLQTLVAYQEDVHQQQKECRCLLMLGGRHQADQQKTSLIQKAWSMCSAGLGAVVLPTPYAFGYGGFCSSGILRVLLLRAGLVSPLHASNIPCPSHTLGVCLAKDYACLRRTESRSALLITTSIERPNASLLCFAFA